MSIHIGTSGWHYAHWRGRFYPEALPPSRWLSHYAREFCCVELNNSFYQLPEATTVRGWVQQTPPDFRFAVKVSRLITHMKKLRDCAEPLRILLDAIGAFGEKLGPILFQLPPSWHANPPRLAQFLKELPTGYRYTIEFRDPSWHSGQIYDLLHRHRVAFCQFDLGGFRTPEEVTADFVYVRLHGPGAPYADSYSASSLRGWAERLLRWSVRGKDAYVFFDNDQAAHAVTNARLLQSLCQRTPVRSRSGMSV